MMNIHLPNFMDLTYSEQDAAAVNCNVIKPNNLSATATISDRA